MVTKRRNELSPEKLLEIPAKGRTTLKLRKGQIVFSQGDVAEAVYFIQKGRMKVTVVSALGKEAVAAFLDTGDFFGEASLAGQKVRLATISAMSEAVVVKIEKVEMMRLLEENPAFSKYFMNHVLNRTIRVEADLVDQLFNSSERRLARLLLLLANYGKEGKLEPILTPISQETLAEMIGTTRSRVSFFMNKFRKLGLISYNGHIEVHKSLLTMVLHEKPQIKS